MVGGAHSQPGLDLNYSTAYSYSSVGKLIESPKAKYSTERSKAK